jgi:hypothetical protein
MEALEQESLMRWGNLPRLADTTAACASVMLCIRCLQIRGSACQLLSMTVMHTPTPWHSMLLQTWLQVRQSNNSSVPLTDMHAVGMKDKFML